jgi:hypothetical protein
MKPSDKQPIIEDAWARRTLIEDLLARSIDDWITAGANSRYTLVGTFNS